MHNYLCWIIYNGNLRQEKFIELASWLDEVAKGYLITSHLVKNNELFPTIENGKAALKGNWDGRLPDFALFMDKDVILAKHLEMMGVSVYNSAACIELCDNKSLTYQALANHGIPMPKTMLSPLVFQAHQDLGPYQIAIKELSFPMVIKEAFGSFGMQVHLVHHENELYHRVKEIGNRPFLLQEFISSSKGRDIRLNVVGDQVVASMMRISEYDFRANVSNGGNMHRYKPSEAEKELAITCSKLVGADFAGVDLLFAEDGSPLVCEINSNAHIKNIYDCTGINVATYIIPHVLLKWQEGQR